MIWLEQGWRRCERCRTLVSSDRAEGYACVDGSSHATRDDSWEYMVPSGDPPPPGFQPQWRVCTLCAGLYYRDLPGLCAATGGPHVPADFDSGAYPQRSEHAYSAAYGDYPGTVPGWRFCRRCAVMWSLDHGEEACAAGGSHDPTGSAEYLVFRKSSGLAAGVACEGCAGLVLGQDPARGCVSPDGAHSSAGMATQVSFGGRRADAESGWTQCRHCSSVFLGGPSAGVCRVPAADGSVQPHDGTDSLPYLVTTDVAPVDELAGWRHCARCALLVYTAQEVAPCPAGDQHELAASARYSTLARTISELDLVPGWGRCLRCRSLVLRAVDDGICRDGGVHDLSDGRAYLISALGGYGAETGAWCCRCQALVCVLSHDDAGTCHDGAEHDVSYRLTGGIARDELPPDPVETGWRLCLVCRQFVLTDAGTPVGACAEGATHDVTGSPEYAICYLDPMPEASPSHPVASTRPTLTCTEAADGIVVAGVLFGAGEDVTVTVNLPGTPVTQTTRTDAGGAFGVTFAPVEEAPGNDVLVEAIDESFDSARTRLTAYRPAPP